jgi:S-DNA-T family DNA segregation ATPase FtsK/SpoIIIE
MIGPWKEKILKLEANIEKEREKIEKARRQACIFYKHGKQNAGKVDGYFNTLLKENVKEVEKKMGELPPPLNADWDDQKWQQWSFSEIILEDILHAGSLLEHRDGGAFDFKIPVYIPFIGGKKTIIIAGNSDTADQCLSLLQSFAIRVAAMLPHQAKFTLLDPVGHGQAFPMSQYLPSVRENSGDIRQDLDGVIIDMRRIISTYLDASTPSFEQIQETIRSNEQFEFIFAAHFPKHYDRRAIEALQSIGNSGANAGRYIFIHYNYSVALPTDISIDGFENVFQIDMAQASPSLTACDLRYILDKAPSPGLQKELLERLRKSKPPERILSWDETVGLEPKDWWTENSANIIQTPIGGKGTSDKLNLWFGVNNDNRPCAHGMLGAMTGAGKSNLYHVFILGLAVRYSPDELRLYLIDGKDGVEFQVYRNLPHAEVISLRSAPELSRSILTELIDEKERRNSIFTKVGVRDFTAYREKGEPEGKMARILLLVDEYQELFEGDKDGVASAQLLQLAQQGRSAGIHMLLASQRFGAAGMLNQTAIFGNIHLRIAMQMTLSDRQALTEFGREGKHLIETCNLPGKIVVNDLSGEDDANKIGKVSFLQSDEIVSLIQDLQKKAHEVLSPEALPQMVIFDGKSQPNLIENPQVVRLIDRPGRFTPEEWEARARKSLHQGGLDVTDWFWAEHPHVMWLGQEFNVKGQAKIVIRRRISENALFVGGNNPARFGMLAAMICSLAITSEPGSVEFTILDRSIPGTQWNKTLKKTCDLVLEPGNFTFKFSKKNKDAPEIVEEYVKILEQRSKLDEEELIKLPSLFFLLADPERIDDLVRKMGNYGKETSPLGKQLKKLYANGPALGIHLVVSFSDLGTMKAVFDERQDIENFRHRVALEMSEDDSFTFVRSRQASRLQIDGSLPISAIYVDLQKNSTTRFKPYSMEATIDFIEQLEQIGNKLINWKEK